MFYQHILYIINVKFFLNMRLSACPNPHIFGYSIVTLIGPISHLLLITSDSLIFCDLNLSLIMFKIIPKLIKCKFPKVYFWALMDRKKYFKHYNGRSKSRLYYDTFQSVGNISVGKVHILKLTNYVFIAPFITFPPFLIMLHAK